MFGSPSICTAQLASCTLLAEALFWPCILNQHGTGSYTQGKSVAPQSLTMMLKPDNVLPGRSVLLWFGRRDQWAAGMSLPGADVPVNCKSSCSQRLFAVCCGVGWRAALCVPCAAHSDYSFCLFLNQFIGFQSFRLQDCSLWMRERAAGFQQGRWNSKGEGFVCVRQEADDTWCCVRPPHLSE